MPSYSAIILNYRTPQQTVRCVEALRLQTLPPAEILVVDNHSDDDSIGILRNRLQGIAGIRILESAENTGFGGGYNAGLRRARHPYVLLDNPTKALRPDAAERMLRVMEEQERVGIVGPKLIHEDGTVRDSARSFPSPLDVLIKRTVLERLFPGRMRRYRQLDRDPDVARETDWLIGGCLLLRRAMLEDIGVFDPRFFLFFEDIDLCRRAWDAGWAVRYVPDAVAGDRKRRLSEGGLASLLLRKVGRAHVRSAGRYFWKWRHAAGNRE